MLTRKLHVLGLFHQLSNCYRAIQAINMQTPTLKFVGYHIDKTSKEPIITIQISGKNLFPKLSAKEIVANPSLLLKFDREDQVAIKNALNPQHSHQLSNHKPRILAKTYDRNTKRFFFTVETVEGDQLIKKCHYVNELLKSPTKINTFSKEDVFQIGFEAGKEINYPFQ